MLITITGNATILQEVSLDDAQIMCDLRNDPQRNKFLSSTKPISVEEQQAWMTAKAKKRDNIDFKIIDKKAGDVVGVVAIYDVEHHIAEFGRYICTRSLQAMESEYLILKFGFDIMYLDKMYCRTVKDNKFVWNQHYKYGYKDIREEVLGPRQMLHKIQEITREEFHNYDYSFVDKLTNRFQ